MFVNPIQLLQVSIYSKIMNEISPMIFSNTYNVIICILLFGIYNFSKTELYENYISKNLYTLFGNEESRIVIPTHKKLYSSYGFGTVKERTQSLYSIRFQALNHYIQTTTSIIISEYTESLKITFNRYNEEDKTDYILLPKCYEKIKIFDRFEDKYPIYFEITMTMERIQSDDKQNQQSNRSQQPSYNFILSTPEKHNMSVLNRFMKMAIDKYELDTQEINQPKLFEFINSNMDEDDRRKMMYREFPFKSNKKLDKNIFFEGKNEFIAFIDRFIPGGTDDKNAESDACYELSGVTKKACILLSGPPGCGKSCTIKGILNRTGRHGILVQWGRLKTCSELCTLFRSSKINDTPFSLKEFVFIFEDFDANKNDVLKIRKEDILSKIGKNEYNSLDNVSDVSDESKQNHKSNIKSPSDNDTFRTMLNNMNNKLDDELTLECVLNVLDGIAEMPDAMIIFTTNHLENIDPAFYRSGRVDYRIELQKASVPIIKEMAQTYCCIPNIDDWQHKFDQMKEYVISTADVQSICFNYGKNRVEECLDEIIRCGMVVHI